MVTESTESHQNSSFEKHSLPLYPISINMNRKISDHEMVTANTHESSAPLRIGCYIIEKTIGKGNFAVVKLARHTITQIKVAIKIIDKTSLSPENLVKAQREAEILKMLQHPHIIKLYQVLESPRLLYIVTEYLTNGELFEYIANNGRLSEYVARFKFLEILSAVEHCHRHNVVHRDLKAENMLLDQYMSIKLADFGFGNVQKDNPNALLTTWCGSPPYAAPEIFKGEPYVGTKADVWSLGVLLYVLVVGVLPFGAFELPQLREQVLGCNFRVPFWLSSSCEELLRAMLAKSPSRRPSVLQLYRFKWLSDVETCTPMLPSEPNSIHSHSLMPFNMAVTSGTDLLCGATTIPRPHSRMSLVCPPTLNLAAEMKTGKLNHLVIQIMENNGMKRQQILESLGRCAYDHLTATYLLLGEYLRQTRHSLPQTLAPRPTEIDALVVAQFSDRCHKTAAASPVEIQTPTTSSKLKQAMPRSSYPNEKALDFPAHFSMKDTNLMNVIFPPRVMPQRQKNCVSHPQDFNSGPYTQIRPLPGVSEPVSTMEEDGDASFDSIQMEDAMVIPQAAEFLIKNRVLGLHPPPSAPVSQSPVNLSCQSEVPQPQSQQNQPTQNNSTCFDWWFPDQPEIMLTEDSRSHSHEHSLIQSEQYKQVYTRLTTSAQCDTLSINNAEDFKQSSSSRLLTLGMKRHDSNENKDNNVSYLQTYINDRGGYMGQPGHSGFIQLDPYGKSITDEHTSGLGSSVDAESWNSSFSAQPRGGNVSSESTCEDIGIDIPNKISHGPLFHPSCVGLNPQQSIPEPGKQQFLQQQQQQQSPISLMPEYLQSMVRRKYGVSSRPAALQKHIKKFQQLDPSMDSSVYME